MNCFKSSLVYTLLSGAILLSSCATNPPETQAVEQQRTALQSWKNCLARHVTPGELTAVQLPRLMDYDCEGHKRDVIKLFPSHLANQIDQMLVNTAYRYIDSMHNSSYDPNKSSSKLGALLR